MLSLPFALVSKFCPKILDFLASFSTLGNFASEFMEATLQSHSRNRKASCKAMTIFPLTDWPGALIVISRPGSDLDI